MADQNEKEIFENLQSFYKAMGWFQPPVELEVSITSKPDPEDEFKKPNIAREPRLSPEEERERIYEQDLAFARAKMRERQEEQRTKETVEEAIDKIVEELEKIPSLRLAVFYLDTREELERAFNRVKETHCFSPTEKLHRKDNEVRKKWYKTLNKEDAAFEQQCLKRRFSTRSHSVYCQVGSHKVPTTYRDGRTTLNDRFVVVFTSRYSDLERL